MEYAALRRLNCLITVITIYELSKKRNRRFHNVASFGFNSWLNISSWKLPIKLEDGNLKKLGPLGWFRHWNRGGMENEDLFFLNFCCFDYKRSLCQWALWRWSTPSVYRFRLLGLLYLPYFSVHSNCCFDFFPSNWTSYWFLITGCVINNSADQVAAVSIAWLDRCFC